MLFLQHSWGKKENMSFQVKKTKQKHIFHRNVKHLVKDIVFLKF